MDTADLLRRVRPFFTKAQRACEQWEQTSTLAASVLFSMANVLQRIPLLVDDRNFGILLQIEGCVPLLRARTMESLDTLSKTFTQCITDMESFRDEICKQCNEVRRLIDSSKGFVALQTGQPSPADCMEWSEDLARMYSLETGLKREIYSKVQCSADADLVQSMGDAWTLYPRLDKEYLNEIMKKTKNLGRAES